MARRHLFFSLFVIALIIASAGIPVESRGSAPLQDQGQAKKLTAGRNVNMVSGTTLPNGDPWLQRQNEPSMAVSTRNPLHILAGSNDYRTVDMPIENEQLPGREGKTAAAPDAWLGLYKSVDGGQSWASTLLPGFPQDSSAAGAASPLKYTPAKKRGFTAAADPVVRSGPSGMFYYSGIAFNRTKIPGWVNGTVFISRFIDKNNAEAGDAIQYLDTQIIADDLKLAALFVDKPWIAVDAPLPGASMITINGQQVPRHNVYIAYSVFIEAAGTQTSAIIFRRSPDCGKTWGIPYILSLGSYLNQGATIAIDPRDSGNIYVAWRRFDAKKQTSAIMVARSRLKGILFEIARVVATFPSTQGPFDQPSRTATEFPYGTSFRTNSYPTMAVDDKGIVYLAWAQRGYGPTRESRIVLGTSRDGLSWSPRTPIDSQPSVQGHQFMPSLAFAAGKLTMAWYDQRDDYGGLAFGFDDWISERLPFRHTIDVRAAQADTADYPNLAWKTTQISRYHFTLEEDVLNQGAYKAFQSQWNPPNYQLFSTGTLSFHGDYLDVAASPTFVRSADGRWRFNTAALDNALFHVTWTDNRDVRPPSDGNWANYAPPTSAQLEKYITPGRPVCAGGQQPGMRNQNVYTAQLFSGIEVGSPTNAKALDLDVPRAFAVFVKNNTWEMRSFRLTIAAQPPNGQASFLQFDLLEFLDVTIAPYSTISRQVFINSTDPKASVLVRIEEIDQPDGTVLPDGMTGSVLLNGDPASSGVVGVEETHQPQIENPHIRNWSVNAMAVNPEIDNEDIVNTDIVNPNIVDLDSVNPVLINPNVVDPSLFNPHIRNTDPANPNFVNPHIRNPHIRNESPEDLSVTDVEWPVKNAGNTASSFTFTLLAKEALPEGLYAQLIVYKVHYTPAVAGEALAEAMGTDINSCELKQEPHHEILLNIVNPDLVNPHIRNPNLLNPHIRNAAIENATFVLGPGEEAIVNLRIIESHEAQTTKAMTTLQGFELPVDVGSFIESVGAAVTAQSVDSEDAAKGIEEPKTDATTLIISTSSLPPGTIGLAYPPAPYLVDQARIQAAGGDEPYSWWVNPDELPPGLMFNAASGQISGMPLKESGKTYPRVYSFTVQVTDSGSPQQSANQRFSIAIEDPTAPPPLLTITTASPLPTGTEGTPYGTALNAVGGVWPYTWTRVSSSLPQGLSMDELGTIGGTPSLAGTFAFSVRVVDSASPAQSQEKDYSLTIRAADAPTFSISGRVTLGAGGASLPGVLMRGLPSAPTTDASGSYSDTVPAGWSGTAIPFKAGYYFVPAEISYTNVQSHRLGQNYIAYPVTLDHFDISSIGNAIAGAPFPVTITAKDSRGETVTTYTDANMLSDTTGTISPTMTAPFKNGVWTGQVAIMKTAPDVVIQTSGGGRMSQSNSFNVALGSPSAIRIEDAPNGTGTEIVTKTLGPGHALTVYAVSRDLGNNFVANAAVGWSLIDKTGGIVDGDLVPAGDNMSAVFTAHTAGVARIHAQHASLGADTTGTITVMKAMVDDPYENNDDRAHAAPILLGTHDNLVLMDEDWFKITVLPADAGKDLMIHLKGVSYPDPEIRKDLDMLVFDGSGRLMGYNISGGDDEYAFIPGVTAGDYIIGLTYIPIEGVVYSLTAEVGTNFGIGYIEGRVTDKNGYGLENILVELYGDPFNWDISRPMTTTGANGFYKIGFFPGPYTVLFNINNPDWQDPFVPDVNYLGERYHGNEVVALVAGATVPGINAQLEPGGAITGRVTDSSGTGLNLAAFFVHAGDTTRVAAGLADANGNYVADRLYTGNYKVRARQGAIYGLEWYGGAPSLADGLPVPVRQGVTTSGIDVELGPDMAYLQGRVTDNLGNPISGVLVSAFDEAGINVSGANTDEAGNYRIPRLSTGEVRIYFDAAPAQGNYYSKYFPNEDLLTRAIPVPVKAGETTSGIDAQLSDGGTISGRVTGAPGIGIPGISIRCFDTNGDRYFGTTTDATGNFTLAHVWPDDYKVLFRPETGSLAAEWYSDWSSSSGARVITVGAGRVVSAIDAQLAAVGGSISGRVTSESPIRNMRVLVYDGTRGTLGAHISSAATDAAGTYRIPRLPGTEYKVYFDADRNFLGYNSEYYAGKGAFGQADLVPIILGEPTANISAMPIARTPVDITTASLPEGKQSTFYSALLEASGGRPFYFWSVESGALPNGLTLNGKGEIRGNPSAAGTFNFTVRVTDSTRPQQFDTQAFTVTIGAYSGTGNVISGKVFYSGYGLSGVVMDGLPGSPVTNALGEYNATVSSGWSGTVTPTLAGYAFSPPNTVYTNVAANLPDQNYLASPGFTISGAITLGGAPLPGVLMVGLPGGPRTNSSGVYRAAVPSGWSGSVTPAIPGFSFNPPSRDYTNVTVPQAAQDFTATYASGADDGFEENDSYETAAVITPGTYNDLVRGADEDWFKVYVPASAIGRTLRVHAKGVSYPNPIRRYNLDFKVISESGKLLNKTVGSGDDEYAFIPDLAEGWYFIGLPWVSSVNLGSVYSLSVDIGADFGLGFIEGRVMDEQGSGIEGIYVELQGDPYDGYVSRPMVLTRAGGTYKIAWTPGNYTVYFNAYDWDHGDPWAPDMNYIGDAYDPGRSMPLVAGSTVSGIDIRLAAGGIVTGRVTDAAGNGLNSIYVGLYDSLPLNEYGIDTDHNGFFSIDRILTGNYKIFFQSWEPEIPSVWFDDGKSFDEASPVHVQGGQTTPDINARLGLEPGGYIEGTVTNSTGAPLPSAGVQANDVAVVPNGFTRIFPVTLLSTTTDASGHYRLGPLPGGFIKIAFTSPSLNMVAEHYPDKLMFKDAEPVTVTPGQTTYGIDARLAEAGTISGRVTDAAGNPLGNINIGVIDTDSDRYYVATTNATGNYTLGRVSPDDYKIICYSLRGNFAAEWFDDQGAYSQGSVVAVGAGQNVPGIDFQLEDNGAIITGQVTGGGVPLKNIMVIARDIVNGLRYFSYTYTDMAGNYTLRELPTGQVKLQFVTNWVYGIPPYSTEYYEDKGAFEYADPIATVRGEKTSGINVVLDPYPALTISTPSPLLNGEMAIPYEIHLQASGGKPFLFWSLESGALPDGLTLKGNGVISGVPTATGAFDFTARVIDATLTPQSTSRAYSITIGAYSGTGGYYISGHIALAPPSGQLLAGVVLEGLPGPPATNLQGEYITFVPAGYSGMARPVLAGYGFDPETDGYTDITANRPDQDYVAYKVTLSVITNWLPNGTEGHTYNQALEAGQGTPPYTWSLYSGILPDGLTLAPDGTLNGIPVKIGTYDFVVRVMDTSSPSQRVYQAYSVTINPGGLVVADPILVWKLDEGAGTTALDSSGRGLHGTLNNNVSYTTDRVDVWGFAAETAGNGWISMGQHANPFYFANAATIMAYVKIADFALPRRFVWKLQHDRPDRGFPYSFEAELSIEGSRLALYSRNGLLKGVNDSPRLPTNVDLSDPASGFDTDGYNHIAVTIHGDQYVIFINGAVKASATGAPFNASADFQCFWVMGANWSDYWLGGKIDELTVYNTVLTPEQVNVRYSQGPMMTISGRVTSGGAPLGGVAMNGLPGSPLTNEAGEYIGSVPPGWSGTVTPVRSGYSFEPMSRSYTEDNVLLPIVGEDYAAYAGGSLGIRTGSPPAGWWNTPYDFTLQATSGTLPFSWSVASGRLPAGLTLDTKGRLSGTPTEAGRFPLTIRVTDSGPTPLFVTRSYTLVINTAPEALWTTTYPEGGDIYAQGLVLDPRNPDVVFASANNRGIFKSENGAASWTSNLVDSPDWPYNEIWYPILIAHQSSKNLYVSFYYRILRSTDGGTTWAEIIQRDNWDIHALAIDPTDANIIYVGTVQGGILRTTDGGGTWAPWGSGLPQEEFRDLVVAPGDRATLFAGMAPSGVYVSHDGGATWSPTNSGIDFNPIEDIEVHPSDANIVYILAGTFSHGQGIFKTTDGGANWTFLRDAGFSLGGFTGGGLAIDPTATDTVYVASSQYVLKTTTGGTTWTGMENPVSTANIETVVIDPTNTQVLYAGTAGEGVFKSTNGGVNWTGAIAGMNALAFAGDSAHAIEFDKTNNNIIYAGSFNGGYRSLNRGASWENMGFPQWAPLALRTHPDAPGTVFGIHNSFHKSTSNGAYGTWAQTPGSPCCFARGDIGVSATSPLVIYFGCWGTSNPAAGVYKSSDGGETFTLVNNRLTNTDIHSIAVHPTNADIVFAGTTWDNNPAKDYGLFKTTDGGANWIHLTGGLPHDLQIHCITIHPTSPQIMYFASEAAENTGIYRSGDGGASWAKRSNLRVDALVVHPNNSNILFGGDHHGFYISFDGGVTWKDSNNGLFRNPRIDAITLDPANPYHVFIGTGAGVYEATFDFAPEIVTGSLGNATINQPYYATLYATRGTPPYAWSIEGALPDGFSLDPATGVISGQTADLGTYAFHAKVVDHNGRSFTRGLSITVVEPSTTGMYPLVATASPPEGGTVTRNPDQSLYAEGTLVQVAAAPNPGYVLIGWSGESLAKTSPIQILMTEPKSVSANFAASHTLPDYYISSAAFPPSAAAGATIGGAVSVSVGNLGSGAMNPPALSAGIYLSNDAIVTPEDILLWKGRILFAPPGSTETLALPINPGLQIPTTIAAGTYTIGVIVDDTNAVVERSEGNNVSSRTIAVPSPGYSHLELLGGWPYGSSMGVEIDELRHVALRGHGGLLEILNISDPSHPIVMSQLNVAPSQVSELKIRGNYAYLAGKSLFIVDIQNPSNPSVVGSCPVQSWIRDLEISGNYAIVSDYHYGLRVIDISNPSSPSIVGSLPFDSRTRLLEASGNIIYVTRATHLGRHVGVGGLSIVDISNPASPVELNFLQGFNTGSHMALDKTGNYLFVYRYDALKIYDVSTPADPREVASYGTGYAPGGIRIVGDRAYLTEQNQNKLVILNIENPLNPVEISSYQFQGPTALYRPAVVGNLCLVPSWYDSLKIVDFTNLSSPVERGSLETVGLSNYADVANGYAYVATNRTTSNRLKVLNLANLPNITETASLETQYSIDDVVTSGIHAYLAGGAAGLHAVNVSDPAHPTEAGSNMSAPQAQDIVISGNYAYVADGNNGLKIFDIRTPSNPVLLGSCATPDTAYQLSVSGRYAYLACDQAGLRIIDVSDPANPREAGSHVFSEYVYNVAVWGNHAYVVNGSSNLLWIVDVSDPANPVERSTVDLYYCYGDIGFSGHYMFLPNTFFGLKVVDISNPASPVEVEVDYRLSSPVEVLVRENRIYVVNRDTGFYALEFRSQGGGGAPTGHSIVYSSNSRGTYDVMAMNSDGSNKQNLSAVSHDPGNAYAEYPGKWSPDGGRIAFTSDKSGISSVWIMDADGRNDYKLTASTLQEIDCSWSPDGTKIFLTRNTQTNLSGCTPCPYYEIYAHNLQSGTETRLTDNSYREMIPAISPDGTRIVYAKAGSPNDCCNQTDLWIMNSDGSGQTYLHGVGGLYEVNPLWGKVSNRILFAKMYTWPDYEIVTLNPDGTGLVRLTNSTSYDVALAFSPDNSKILFLSDRGGHMDLYIMDASGNILAQLTDDAAGELGGDWK